MILSAVVAVSCLIYFDSLEYREESEYKFLINIALCSQLGFALFYSFYLISERNKINRWILELSGIILLTLFYFYLPEDIDDDIRALTRYFLFSIGLHMLAAFAPFTGRKHANGFWQYNKTIFLNFLLSILYTYVLLFGLYIAMAAIDNLFGVHIDGKYYFYLFLIMQGIFNTWFFLTRVPENFEKLEEDKSYPKGLKVFTQYVLLPLVTVYLVILYLYEIKILTEWELPKGWVSYLVLGFSIAGILSLLLVHPVREQEGNKWIQTFSRIFYLALFPLVLLLFIAIGTRINQYGVTENRYFILLLALWLTAVSIYFLIRKKGSIKIIPVSLFFLSFLSGFGPWGAFFISDKNQKGRLEEVLERNNLLSEGIIKGEGKEISFEDRSTIYSVLSYFESRNELEEVAPLFGPSSDSIVKSDTYRGNKIHSLMKSAGIELVNPYDHYRWFSFYQTENSVFSIKDYDFFISFNFYGNNKQNFSIGSKNFDVVFEKEDNNLLMSVGKKEIGVSFIPLLKKLESEKNQGLNLPADSLMITSENEFLNVKLYLRQINFSRNEENDFEVSNLSGDILIKEK